MQLLVIYHCCNRLVAVSVTVYSYPVRIATAVSCFHVLVLRKNTRSAYSSRGPVVRTLYKTSTTSINLKGLTQLGAHTRRVA